MFFYLEDSEGRVIPYIIGNVLSESHRDSKLRDKDISIHSVETDRLTDFKLGLAM